MQHPGGYGDLLARLQARMKLNSAANGRREGDGAGTKRPRKISRREGHFFQCFLKEQSALFGQAGQGQEGLAIRRRSTRERDGPGRLTYQAGIISFAFNPPWGGALVSQHVDYQF